jgi:hypothetical protein
MESNRLGEYTRCFFKRQTAEALKVKEQIEIALNSKLLEEESNAKFRNYIDNAPDGVLLLMKKEII